MSKKNNKATKRRIHVHDLQKEKEQLLEKKKKEQKQTKSVNLGVSSTQKKRTKKLRLRKHVTIRGIKVKDADSKRKILKVLRREQAEKLMDVETSQPKKSKKRFTATAKPISTVQAMEL